MAFKQVGTKFVKVAAGDSVTGYLKYIGQQYFPPKKGQTEGSTVPTFILVQKDGTLIKVNTGASVTQNVENGLFKLGLMTRISKPKDKVTTSGGNQLVEWLIEQDDADILQGAA